MKTPDLADGAVATAKLAGGAVTSDKVADESLRGSSKMLGGGAGFDFPSGDVSSSRPDGTGWFAAGQRNGTVAQNLTVYVLCVL